MSLNPLKDDLGAPFFKAALVVLVIVAALLAWVSFGVLTGRREVVEMRDGQIVARNQCQYLTLVGSVRSDPVVDARTGAEICPAHPPAK